VFDIVSSDHAPFRFDDSRGKMLRGPQASFRHVPNGIPGIETRLPLLFSEGVSAGRIDLSRFVALASTNAARLYGLYPRKGTLAIGSDADIAIWDPEAKVTIANVNLHHNVDYTPYEGFDVMGWPETVISRGDIVVDERRPEMAQGRGQFLRCARPTPARSRSPSGVG
jgi:dihydropyrimidinase